MPLLHLKEPQYSNSVSARLWRACKEEALNSLYHPFVLQLATGALPKEAFQIYITQDAIYLQARLRRESAFARAYGHALTKAPDAEGMRAFHKLMGSALEELTLHEAFAEKWGVNLAEAIDRDGPLPATRAYTSFLLQIGGDSRSTCADVLAAMAPCMRLYAFLGTTLAAAAAAANSDTPYRAWIAAYSSPEFGAAAATVERLLDKYAAAAGGLGRYDALLAHYRTAMALEYAFFDASGLEAGLKGDPAALEVRGD
ncbi:putative TenA family transcriptional activator [Tribonema minus]|uniref:Putative TenA family transcriptional activator n=1 Tax=Tribonema minus TaxID=303371 RepID=A0A835YZC1_9STRA|nr:putative TenA family transcriptional activator [Tribonema minus]